MRILMIDTGLFPDSATVGAAVDTLNPKDHELRRTTLPKPADDTGWDAVVTAIQEADVVVTV